MKNFVKKTPPDDESGGVFCKQADLWMVRGRPYGRCTGGMTAVSMAGGCGTKGDFRGHATDGAQRGGEPALGEYRRQGKYAWQLLFRRCQQHNAMPVFPHV